MTSRMAEEERQIEEIRWETKETKRESAARVVREIERLKEHSRPQEASLLKDLANALEE